MTVEVTITCASNVRLRTRRSSAYESLGWPKSGPEAGGRSVLASHGLLPARLTFEITESQLPVLGANRPMRHLRESGVQIALDDFGTGYSSLAQLARLPVDILKIDRDFIRNLGESAGRPVMDAIISLSKALGLTTVAEGIEDLGQAAEASNAGIDIGQGYLFSRPLTVDDFALRLPPLSASPPPPVSASPDPITHPITDSDQAAPRREDNGPWEAPSARAPQRGATGATLSVGWCSRSGVRNQRVDPVLGRRLRYSRAAGQPGGWVSRRRSHRRTRRADIRPIRRCRAPPPGHS
jgi:hypothetical protein